MKMLKKISYAILTICICVQISQGQISFFKNDNPFSDSVSSPQLNKEKSPQLRTQSSNSFLQVPFKSAGTSSDMSSSYPISPVPNKSLVENFVNDFNSAVYASKTLTDIFDLRDLSAEAFSNSMYDYAYSCTSKGGHSDPHYIASLVATPMKDGIDSYSLQDMLNIFANSVAKYLSSKGTLNQSNASSLAREYARIMEESAKRNWAKETPASKFFVVEEGFTDFMKFVDFFNVDTFEELAIYWANEVKKVAGKS